MSKESFQRAIQDGSFILTADCAPPRGFDAATLRQCIEPLNEAVTAVYVPESEDGPRMSSLAACKHLLDAGAEPIMALLTRDQNRIALQSTILGAASMGVKNILCLTGRHQTLTSSGSARGVFDVDPVQLVRIAAGMRMSGELADGTKADKPLDLVIGVDTNPFADPIDLQITTIEKAARAGANFAITQPVFNLDRFNVWMSHVRERGLHTRLCVIASVMPLSSAQQAVSLAEANPHLSIRDEDVARLDAAQDQRAAGTHLAAETIAHLRKVEGVRGIHMVMGGNASLTSELMKTADLARS